ncbi:unnamed protein product [Protopolystoma xenopodis]|uniref:Secreted protein n=1 Tax=Protopolystoma xenopodis TaxID=117903 RepID=A0A3S5C725_9PLAT|nr:unnamed protein product [Protopolystoma xenopodis]
MPYFFVIFLHFVVHESSARLECQFPPLRPNESDESLLIGQKTRRNEAFLKQVRTVVLLASFRPAFPYCMTIFMPGFNEAMRGDLTEELARSDGQKCDNLA